jgi:hypothetical protein
VSLELILYLLTVGSLETKLRWMQLEDCLKLCWERGMWIWLPRLCMSE